MNDRDSQRALEHVDARRLEAAIAELARFGGRDDGGVSRQTLTDVENDARRYLVEKARQLGCEVAVDDCANLFFTRKGTEALPPVLTGSHVDTQPIGGKLDGAYGIVAGLEVLEALNDANIKTRRPIEVVVWTNEEGCRFAPGAMGSSAFVAPERMAKFEDSVDGEGVTLRDALAKAFSRMPDVPRRAQKTPVTAFVEAHIEQGPVLEKAGASLGAVTGIQSVRWYKVDCPGVAAHAGTTPMDVRRDAMTTALEVAQRLNALARTEPYRAAMRLTLGHWVVSPNSINTIPGNVVFSIDVRSGDERVLEAFEKALHEVIGAHREGRYIKSERIFARAPTHFPDELQALVAKGCAEASGVEPVTMISGAFHDSMYLAEHCPTCMIFVSSREGISHNAAEYSSPEDLYLGAKALAYVVTTLANR
jgi:N-carbamoyl-L-amino-acid hydrolase